MALDYIIDVDCEVKRQLTKEGMVSMIKQRDRAEALIDVLKREGKSSEEALRHTFKLQLMTPNGVEETEQAVSNLLESTRHLETLQAQCLGCALRVDGMYEALFRVSDKRDRPCCCYHSINYPISGKAESWLAEKAKNAYVKGGANAMVIDYILDKKVTGREFRALRSARNNRFLELKKPLDVALGNGMFRKKAVNTDQILSVLFGYPVIGRAHMVMLLCLVDALKVDVEKPDGKFGRIAVSVKGKDGRSDYWSFDMEDDDNDDRSILQLKDFFRSMFLACVLGYNITIDR
jgi:hypothetical protein